MQRRTFIQTLAAAFCGSSVISNPIQAALPKSKNTLLLDTPLAGFQFYEGERFFNKMQTGHKLTLEREIANAHDSNTIAVYWHNNIIGYLPHKNNVVIAQMLDRGEKLHATISGLQQAANAWDRVWFEVFLKT